MPPAKKTVRRAPARRSVATSTAVATQTMTSTKLALATLFLGFSAMAAAAMGTSTPTTSTPSGLTPPPLSAAAPTSTIVVIAPATDYDNASRIILATTSERVAKWNLGTNASVVIKKMRFNALNGDYTERKNATEFGTMVLRENGWGPVLGTAQFQPGLGYVEFDFPSGLALSPSQQKSISLHAQILETLKPNSLIRFGVNIGSANTWVVETTSGAKLPMWQLRFNNTTFGIGAPGPLHLYHLTTPEIYSYGLQYPYTFALAENAKFFPISFYNRGIREFRVSKLMVKVTTSGMVGTTSTSGGVLSGFKLWETDASGNLGTLVATAPATTCIVGPLPGGLTAGTRKLSDGRVCGINQTFAIFDNTGPDSTVMANYKVSPKQSRTLVVTADTRNVFVGKAVGEVKIRGEIAGQKGQFPSSNPKVPFWGNGGVSYHYTPVAGTENVQPYSQSDYYSITGQELTRSL